MIDFDSLVAGPLLTVFGEPVQYRPVGTAPFQITGVFDKAYHKDSIFSDGSVAVTTETPVLGVQLSQFRVQPSQFDQLYVYSVNTTYAVREVRLDGHGIAKLMLNKVSSP